MTGQENQILLVEDNAADVEMTLHALRQEKLGNEIESVGDDDSGELSDVPLSMRRLYRRFQRWRSAPWTPADSGGFVGCGDGTGAGAWGLSCREGLAFGVRQRRSVGSAGAVPPRTRRAPGLEPRRAGSEESHP